MCHKGHSVRLIFFIFVVASSGICLVRSQTSTVLVLCAGTCVDIWCARVIACCIFYGQMRVVSYMNSGPKLVYMHWNVRFDSPSTV